MFDRTQSENCVFLKGNPWFPFNPSLNKREVARRNRRFLLEELNTNERRDYKGTLVPLKETQNNKEGAGGVSRPTVGENVVPLGRQIILIARIKVKGKTHCIII